MVVVRGRRGVPAVVVAIGLVVGAVACGGDEFQDRAALVELGGATETYQVDSCGLDDETVYVVARSPQGAVLQAVMGVTGPDRDAVPESTGFSVDLESAALTTRVAAFGDEAWERRGETGPVPGSIASARLRGSRIQFDGEVVAVTEQDRPVPGALPEPFAIDIRCDLQED